MKTTNKIILMTILLSVSLGIYAQSPLWLVGSNYYDQNLVPLILPTPAGPSGEDYDGTPARASSNACHNPITGELLFFIVDGAVYDAEGYIIDRLNDGTGNVIGFSETLIVPDPGNCARYYIFSASWPNLQNPQVSPRAVVSLLDLSLPRTAYNSARSGALVEDFAPNQNLNAVNLMTAYVTPGQHYTSMVSAPIHISCTPKLTDGTHLLVVQWGNMVLYHFKITATGIEYVFDSAYAVTQNLPASQAYSYNQSITANLGYTRSELEIFQRLDGNFTVIGNFKGVAYIGSPNQTVEEFETLYKYDIDAITSWPIEGSLQIYEHRVLGNPSSSSSIIKGFELSPDKRYLYITSTPTSALPKSVHCLDMNTFQLVNLPNIPNFNNLSYSRIERAANGELYLAAADGLYRINSPNDPATASIQLVLNTTINLSDLYQDTSFPGVLEYFGQYLLPDQMDFDPNCQINCYSYNCASNNQEIACCNLYSSANVFVPTQNFPDYVVESSATWLPGLGNNPFSSASGVVEFNGNLVIRPGATLTVNGMTLKFSSKSRVIVERDPSAGVDGARLVSQNTLFTTTDDCGGCFLWPGIEVQGHNNLPQSSTKHARVDLQTGTIIEHAYFGVLAGRIVVPDQVGQGFWESFSGGIINTHLATFRNNRHDIYFTPYSVGSSISYITETNFITDQELRLSLSQIDDLKHIVIGEISGVTIEKSVFENVVPMQTDGIARGKGISSLNANYYVGGCDFKFLDYGIWAENANSALPFVVESSEFIRNFHGIFALNVMSLIVTESQFELFNTNPSSLVPQTTGISLTGCNRYRVAQNSFTDNTQTHPNAQTYGVVVFNSGPFSNVIENNSFSNLHSGGVSAGVNAASYTNPNTNLRGLQWLCNDFSDNKVHDLWVRSGRIAPWLGACNGNPLLLNTAAGNKFNTSQNPAFHVFLGPNVPQILYFRGSPSNENPTLTNINPTNIILCNSNNTICNLGRPGGDGDLSEQDLKNLRLQLIDEKYAAKLLLDYSDKDNTINQVLSEYLTPEQKRDILVSGTTVISDEVLIKYILSSPPHTMLYQVLVHNSPLSEKVIYYMMEESNMTNGMKQQVLYIQNGLPENEAILQHIQNIDLNIAHIENGLISMYLQDSTASYTAQDVVNLIDANPHKELLDLELLFHAYLTAKNATQADSLNTILKSINTDQEYAILNDLAVAAIPTDYYTVIYDDSLLIAQLEDMAYNSDYMYAYPARAILSGVLGYKFEYPIDEEFENRSAILPSYKYDGTPIEIITIFPNPTTDNFFIVFDENADVSQNREARVYDLAGNLQFTRSFDDNAYVLEINTDNMTKGMYIVVISANGTDIGTYKVAVR
jgi:hypothetical protein